MSLEDWVNVHWSPLLGYKPDVFYLTKGWFGFHFKQIEDTELILGKVWTFDGGSLMIKRWRVSFDPAHDYFRFKHFWVLLSGLSLHFWHAKALEAIGNTLGKFISADLGALKATDKRICRVLVEIDIHSGLLETLEIVWRGHHLSQSLDYLGIPFRCSRCRKTGHLWRDCMGLQEEEEFRRYNVG
jgi:hypothetical protein